MKNNRDEFIKGHSRKLFALCSILTLIIIGVIIFFPYYVGMQNTNYESLFGIPPDSSIGMIWLSGILELFTIAVILLVSIGVILLIRNLYCWMWDISYNQSVYRYNKKYGRKK